MKRIKTIALVVLVLLTLDYLSYTLFQFPSLFHYAALHPHFAKWHAFVCGLCAFISLLWLNRENER